MQIQGAISASVGTGTATTAAAASGTASTAGQTGGTAGFGSMLVQVIGLNGSAAASNGGAIAGGLVSLPDLQSLIAGLSATATESGVATQADGLSALAKQLLQKLENDSDSLKKLLDTEEGQAWMLQAASLLQALQLIPAEVAATLPPATSEDAGSDLSLGMAGAATETPRVTVAQAQALLQAFQQAVQQPELRAAGGIFLQQLQEKLGELMAKQPGAQVQLQGDATHPAAQAASTSGDVKRTQAAAVSVLQGVELNGKVKITAGSGTSTATAVGNSTAGYLEVLAAKTQPITHLVQTTESASQAAVPLTQANGAAEDTVDALLPFPLTQEEATKLTALSSRPSTVEGTLRSTALAEDLSRFMLGKLQVRENSGLTEARLLLTPEALGQVEVKLSMQNGQLVAQFAAHTAVGKDLLESQMAQLRATLQNQGIQVEKLEVTQSAPSLASSMFQGDRQQQQQTRQNGRQSSGERQQDGAEDYAAEASAILNRTKADTAVGFDTTV